jgi:pilus assembly protein CpaE
VTTLDVPTLKNVKIASETLDLLNFPKERRMLVLNRADDKVGLTADKVESTLGMKIAASIPTSPQVANATNAGEPIIVSLPKHPVSAAIHALASRATRDGEDTSAEVSAAAPGSRAAPKRGLLRRNGR